MAAKAKKAPAVVDPGALDEEGKKEALQTAIKQLKKQYGEGTIMKLGENTHMTVQAVHTGSLSLDLALGIGGVPRGRIIEIFGPESSGKTTVALHIIAEVQKLGGTAAFVDAFQVLEICLQLPVHLLPPLLQRFQALVLPLVGGLGGFNRQNNLFNGVAQQHNG
jgi:hypothetical protein